MAGDDGVDDSHKLEPCARVICGIVGALVLAGGVLIGIAPPSKQAFPPQCAEAKCVGAVSGDLSALAIAVAVLGSLLIVVAVNGRRLLSFEMPGGKLTWAQQAEKVLRAAPISQVEPAADEVAADQDVVEETADVIPDAAPEPIPTSMSTVEIDGLKLQLFAPEQIPNQVVADLLSSPPSTKAINMSTIQFAARKAGQGNFPWLVVLRDQSMVRVAYGGKGKREPTVSLVIDGGEAVTPK